MKAILRRDHAEDILRGSAIPPDVLVEAARVQSVTDAEAPAAAPLRVGQTRKGLCL